MSQNREEILADFQACTGIEDLGEAIFYLDDTGWDLLAAVNKAVPQETQKLPSQTASGNAPDVEMAEPTLPASSIPMSLPMPFGALDENVVATASTSTATFPNPRFLNFQISYGETEHVIQVPDTATYGYLKKLVEEKIKTPACRLELQGWERTPSSDKTALHNLHLSANTSLVVVIKDSSPDGASASEESKVVERLTQHYTLKIWDETHKREYNLKFPGTYAISQVKQDMFEVTDIPVRHQKWSGWPSSVTDDSVTLACSGINYPEHYLTLIRSLTSVKENKKSHLVVDLIESDSSAEEFEDASETFTPEDDIFNVEVQPSRRLQRLIPDNVDDEVVGSIAFSEEYNNRYGDHHPLFFQGSLEEAVKEACNKPARERRPLAIYLHHDGSVLTNVFCTQLLNSESVVNYLSEHFVIWGWDITYESNKSRLLTSASQCLGPMAAHIIRSVQTELFPAILVANKIRSSIEIVTVMHGNMGVNELMSSLIQVRERFAENQIQEVQEEDERLARDRVKREQDEAYQASLEIDRAKEQAKREQEMAKTLELERIRSAQQEEEARQQALKDAAASRLPIEPEEGIVDGVCQMRIRLPSGEFLSRRFLFTSTLGNILDFLLVQGYSAEKFKLLTSWPRRDLTALNPSNTLQELSLHQQETVILEER